ncbi:unnamed protein product, partial [Meganyctiphanes norvegica]
QISKEFDEMEDRESDSKHDSDDDDEYQVEHILMQRQKHGKTQFLIKWRGFDQSESTWEPEENLEGCQELLNSFHNQTKCFCSGPGYWYDRMLECQRCKHWFHESCVACLKYKLIPGDQFYCYVCEFCNQDKEFIHRLAFGWKELVHLALFNLLHSKNLQLEMARPIGLQRYFDYEDHITPWINYNWDSFQCPPDLQVIPKKDRPEHILKTLIANKSRFKCGTEIRKRKSLFTLKGSSPPSVREIVLPEDFPITEASMAKISFIERAIAMLPVLKTFKVDEKEWKKISFVEEKAGPKKRRSLYYCGECVGCRTQQPCGRCVPCEDKPMFGGPGRAKQKCLKQLCDDHPKKRKMRNRESPTFQNPYQHFMEDSSVFVSGFESTRFESLSEHRLELVMPDQLEL